MSDDVCQMCAAILIEGLEIPTHFDVVQSPSSPQTYSALCWTQRYNFLEQEVLQSFASRKGWHQPLFIPVHPRFRTRW